MPEEPKEKKLKPPALPSEIANLPELVNTLASRVRLVEERTGELRKMIKLLEENFIKQTKKSALDLRALTSDLNDLKRAIITIQDRMEAIVNELKLRAKKEELDLLKRYVELWNLVKFVTEDQVIKIVEEKLAEQKTLFSEEEK